MRMLTDDERAVLAELERDARDLAPGPTDWIWPDEAEAPIRPRAAADDIDDMPA